MARKESVGYWNVTHNRRRRSSKQYYGPLSFDVSSDSLPEDSGQHLSIHGFTKRYGGASVYIHSAQLHSRKARRHSLRRNADVIIMPYYHRYDKVNNVFIVYERENEYAREYEVCRCSNSQYTEIIVSALNARASLMRALGLKDAE